MFKIPLLISGSLPKLTTVLKTILTSTALSFVFLLFYPLFVTSWSFLLVQARHLYRPSLLLAYPILIGLSLCTIIVLAFGPRFWRSLQLGLISLLPLIWTLSLTAFLILLDFHHPFTALGTIIFAEAFTWAQNFVAAKSTSSSNALEHSFDPDMPLSENGKDLLGRTQEINNLVSLALRERPSVIAVTGEYGAGKTSLLNLTVGELRKLDKDLQPIIVRFSPWLAANSNSLVISLFTSIVAQIRKEYLIRGLRGGAIQYARALVSMVPKADSLKELLKEPSQQEQIQSLATYIAAMPKRILVILDDLDRMEARELETILKILRGSEELSSVTFVCSFHYDELAAILKVTRRFQKPATFLEKFFQVNIPLLKIEASQIKRLFATEMSALHSRVLEEALPLDFPKYVDDLWNRGGDRYFTNLRRLRLFTNKLQYSFQIVGREVNFQDFLELELIRDISPSVYEAIYLHGNYFYDAAMAFETWGKQLAPLDKEKAKKMRTEFYDKIKKDIPEEQQYVFGMLGHLFPFYAEYDNSMRFRVSSEEDAEAERRIFHPRFFRQYFELRTPSELFSQRDFYAFLSSLKGLVEPEAIRVFDNTFKSIIAEDFKRWHFMHLIEERIKFFDIGPARGLCRGMAQNASIWRTRDTFEFDIGIRCSYQTLVRVDGSSERQAFLRALADDSTSALYTLYLIWIIEKDKNTDRAILSDIESVKPHVAERMKAHYLGADAPSVYDEFGSIDPHQVLFAWRRLGPEAEADQKQYVKNLLANSKNLDKFLKLLFRPMMDDYSILKPFFDFDEIATFIREHQASLDQEKVAEFFERYNREKAQVPGPPPSVIDQQDISEPNTDNPV